MRRSRSGVYSRYMAELRAAFGGRCEECGSSSRLEFAHVISTGLNGRGRGMPQRVHDIRRHPECYRLLCRPCHLAFDREKGPALPEEVPF